jgi:hypothetical protein
MSGDTILAIVAVSLTAIFISVFAIECDRVWQPVPGIPAEGDGGASLVQPPARMTA